MLYHPICRYNGLLWSFELGWVDAIHGVTEFSLTAHLGLLARARNDISRRREVDVQSALSSLLESFPSPVCRTVRRAVDFQTSGWLTVLPLACHQFDLSAQQFRDAFSLRYHRPLSMMPSSCDRCGSAFSLSHALDCCKGGLVTQHHNEVRDALGDLVALAYKDVNREPVVREGNAEVSALVTDLGIWGVWLPQTEALLDIRVTNADVSSYLTRSIGSVLAMAEEEKKRKYVSTVEAHRGYFSPLL